MYTGYTAKSSYVQPSFLAVADVSGSSSHGAFCSNTLPGQPVADCQVDCSVRFAVCPGLILLDA